MPRTTFAAFRDVLLDLGFVCTSDPANAALLEHPETDTVILLRPLAPTDEVPQIIVLGYRRILDERGVVSADEFDDLLRQRSAAS